MSPGCCSLPGNVVRSAYLVLDNVVISQMRGTYNKYYIQVGFTENSAMIRKIASAKLMRYLA